VRGLGEGAAGVEVFADGGVVPIGKVGDEVEQRGAQFLSLSSNGFWVLPRDFKSDATMALRSFCLRDFHAKSTKHFFAAFSTKCRRAVSSAGSGHNAAQITARHAANGRRAHQICSVEISRVRRDALDRQVNFDEAFGVGGH
jgi:hypothetical protein